MNPFDSLFYQALSIIIFAVGLLFIMLLAFFRWDIRDLLKAESAKKIIFYKLTSIVHFILGAATAFLIPFIPWFSALILFSFTVFEVADAAVSDHSLSDFVEYLLGFVFGMIPTLYYSIWLLH